MSDNTVLGWHKDMPDGSNNIFIGYYAGQCCPSTGETIEGKTLIGEGAGRAMTGKVIPRDWGEAGRSVRGDIEHRCEYCGRINPSDGEVCKSCGALL